MKGKITYKGNGKELREYIHVKDAAKLTYTAVKSKKYSNKLMQLRVLLQFIAVLALVGFAYFFKD